MARFGVVAVSPFHSSGDNTTRRRIIPDPATVLFPLIECGPGKANRLEVTEVTATGDQYVVTVRHKRSGAPVIDAAARTGGI